VAVVGVSAPSCRRWDGQVLDLGRRGARRTNAEARSVFPFAAFLQRTLSTRAGVVDR
jgi:hypothetical protein